MSNSKSAIVVGSGVIGAFTAYFLLEKGWAVTLIDKERFGRGSSQSNCGLIVPNHVLPLNSPAALIQAIPWMLKKDAPLYIKPQFNPGLLKWFYRFGTYCTPESIRKSANARHALLQSSFRLYPLIIEKENLQCDWEIKGSLHVFKSKRKWADFFRTDALLRTFGIKATPLDPTQLLDREPALKAGVAGGWFYQKTAQLRPEKLMHELHRLLSAKGARILEESEVTGFHARDDVASVFTHDREISGDRVVLATGAWTPVFEKSLACCIPIQPGKGYSLTMDRFEKAPELPCFFEEKRIVATPWQEEYRVGGTMEFSGYDPSLNQRRLSALQRRAFEYCRQAQPPHVRDTWCGFRPMTVDGLPIIGRSRRFKNVFIAAGHNMVGLSMGPGTGKLVAELLNNDRPHVDPHPYRAGRFGDCA